ncbi:hypothetical protein CELD12_15740 [Cellulomonas sp. NTE-D12]|nr:hypothetical protein CELD12_15740 [Cellulomonas sp. NTE-D12]
MYLLAPEARRGIKARVRATRWVLATAVCVLVACLDAALFGSRWHPLWLGLAVLVGVVGLGVALLADTVKPSTRPYSADLDRW